MDAGVRHQDTLVKTELHVLPAAKVYFLMSAEV